MMPERPGVLAGRAGHAVIALCVSAAVLVLLAFGYGPVPALGRALDPGHGAWTSAEGGLLPRSQALTLPGLNQPVSVAFTSHGVPSIRAADLSDAFLALGYLHARFRLSQMDLERRLGEGRVAQLAGPRGVSSDKFELRLGLLRTAQQEWAQTPPSSPAGQALLAYSRGVNDYLAQARASGGWPSRLRPHRGLPARLDPGGQPGHPGCAHPGAGLHHHPARLRRAGAHPGRRAHHGLVPSSPARPPVPLRSRSLPLPGIAPIAPQASAAKQQRA